MYTKARYQYYAQLKPSATHALCNLEIDWEGLNADHVNMWSILEFYRLKSVKEDTTSYKIRISDFIKSLES